MTTVPPPNAPSGQQHPLLSKLERSDDFTDRIFQLKSQLSSRSQAQDNDPDQKLENEWREAKKTLRKLEGKLADAESPKERAELKEKIHDARHHAHELFLKIKHEHGAEAAQELKSAEQDLEKLKEASRHTKGEVHKEIEKLIEKQEKHISTLKKDIKNENEIEERLKDDRQALRNLRQVARNQDGDVDPDLKQAIGKLEDKVHNLVNKVVGKEVDPMDNINMMELPPRARVVIE